MAHHVCVTKVTVQYAINGRAFTVDFDPMQVASIIFRRPLMDAALQKGLRPDAVSQRFDPVSGIPKEVDGVRTHATVVAAGRSDAQAGGALWWLTDEGVWFHPKE